MTITSFNPNKFNAGFSYLPEESNQSSEPHKRKRDDVDTPLEMSRRRRHWEFITVNTPVDNSIRGVVETYLPECDFTTDPLLNYGNNGQISRNSGSLNQAALVPLGLLKLRRDLDFLRHNTRSAGDLQNVVTDFIERVRKLNRFINYPENTKTLLDFLYELKSFVNAVSTTIVGNLTSTRKLVDREILLFELERWKTDPHARGENAVAADVIIQAFDSEPETLDRLVKNLSTRFGSGNTLLHNSKALKLIFPILLEKLSTEDLIHVMSVENNSDQSAFDTITKEVIDSLSRLQLLRLCAVLETSENLGEFTQRLPPFAQEYIRILQLKYIPIYELSDAQETSMSSIIRDIKGIGHFNQEEKDAALAHFIESSFVPLKEIEPHLSKQEFLRLSTYLRHADLSDFADFSLGQELLQNCPNLNVLHISNDSMLRGITELPLLQHLICHSTDVTQLPTKLPLLKTLDCGYTGVTQLPAALPLLTFLDCSFTGVTQLPAALPLLKTLYCSHNGVTQLPAELSSLINLNCSHTGVTQLPAALPLLQTLDCSHTGVTQLPTALPLLQTLDCSYTGVTELPQLSWNATVVSSLEFEQLKIDVEKFTIEPLKLLCQLGQFLLNNRHFPNVSYFVNGQRDEAIDAGGVRRDFITRLCENVFKSNPSNERGKFLKHVNGVPTSNGIASSIANDDGETQAYQTLGYLFALCYAEGSSFKTGPLFNKNVYECLTAPGDPTSNQWFLYNYLNGKLPQQTINSLINQESTIPGFTEVERNTLALLLDTDPSMYTQDYSVNHRKTLCEDLLKQAREDRKLLAISWIAEGMKRPLSAEKWASLRTLNAQALKDRIEGVLTFQALKNKLKWEYSGNNVSSLVRTKGFLNTWINKSSMEQLELFVRAVTGNKSLSAEDLKVEVSDLGPERLPVAHTCFNSIELSADYESQDQFDAKLQMLLSAVQGGSGFSLT